VSTPAVRDAVDAAFREEWGRVVGALIRRTGDWDLAEECAQEAFAEALRRWPADGVPRRPGGWLTTVAGNRAVDRLRRAARGAELLERLAPEAGAEPTGPDEPIEDDYRVPPPHLLPERTAGVLAVLYLMFNEGYAASTGTELIRAGLCDEAIRLARAVGALMPGEPEVTGTLALMLLQHSRRHAPVGPGGELVTLEEQDRSRWDRAEIDEGLRLAGAAVPGRRFGPYQLQASIAACHARADPGPSEAERGYLLRRLGEVQPAG
jgi:RNA polymerase sigma-70 factor (ECF subfamily)